MSLQVVLSLVLISCTHFVHSAVSIIPCPIGTGATVCVCTTNIIDCSGHNLTTVPNFISSTVKFNHLRLGNNRITTTGRAIFASLNSSDIDLSYNQITSLDSQTFNGIETFLEILNLTHNQLTVLPSAIQTLSVLKTLDVSWNPIAVTSSSAPDFSGTVMRQIGDSVIRFRFGSKDMTAWPDTLSHLNQLQELTVAGVQLVYWPPGAFHGFERTLKKLTIEDLSTQAVPLGIAFFTQLQELHLNNLQYPFSDESLISLPFSQLASTLKVLSLKNDSLTYFPDGIKDLTSLRKLTLDGNKLEFVSDEAIQLLKSANVTALSLQDCELKRVPGAISDLTNLRELDLSSNIIRSIESTDLQNLANLQSLKLNYNPLKYISDNSLCGLENLLELELRNTSLTQVSTAFKNLIHLQKLDLETSSIDCTCDLTWMNYWVTSCAIGLDVYGACETIDQVLSDYITVRLPSCPGFFEDHLDFQCNGTCSIYRQLG